jgi:hypothetical protein
MTKLRFIVIPTKNNYEEYSEEIVSKIKDVEDCTADLDKSYNETLNSRVNKYKKNNKNVITIGLSEVEHNTIMIHFNGTRPKTMELDEFVELLESYDEEDSENDDSSSSSSDDDDVKEMFQKQKSKSKSKSNKLEGETKETEEKEEEEEGCTIS